MVLRLRNGRRLPRNVRLPQGLLACAQCKRRGVVSGYADHHRRSRRPGGAGTQFKFAAELQDKQAGLSPVLIRIETDAGHGAGTPVSKTIEQYADIYAFTLNAMGYDDLPSARIEAPADNKM
jgi:Serine proteases of the peptidase family S9A